MKNLSPSLKASFEADVSTLCRLLTITLTNATVLRRTDLDRDVKLGLNTYSSSGIDASAFRQSSIGGGSGGTLTLVLSEDAGISEQMVRSGALTGAKYIIEVIDYDHPEYGTMILGVGQFGEINFTERGECDISLDSLFAQGSATNIGENYSQECRNDFGDQYCLFDVEALRVSFIIDLVTTNQAFVANELTSDEDDEWMNGVVTFTSGDNIGTSVEVAFSSIDGSIYLALPPPYVIQPGDEASIVPGCTKQRTQCRGKYDNLLNYRGEPDVPTIDKQQLTVALDASMWPPAPPEEVDVHVYA